MQVFDQDLAQAKCHQGGTHRACSPAQTLARYQPLMRQLGITRLANITGLDTIGLPVWVAMRPNARGLATSQGKGLNSDCAKVSALMESIETWHAEHIELPLRQDSLANLSRHAPVIDIAGLPVYADSQLRPDMPLTWVQGWDLLQQQACWLPLDCVSTNYVQPARGAQSASFVQSSNGLSSGNHLLEAISHGLAELIERDAVALSGHAMRAAEPALRIDPASVADADCRQLLTMLERAGQLVALYDIRSDLGIPVCGCTIVDDRQALQRWRTLPAFNGYGCHLSPQIALLRAISEAVQSRLTHISGSRDDIFPSDYMRGGNPDDLLSYQQRIGSSAVTLDFAAIPSLVQPSFEADIELMLQALRRVGLKQAVVVDLSRAELGVPVVKVVVPGLAAPTPMLRGRSIRAQSRSLAQLWQMKEAA
ncbi:YcaO-like family protein [Paucibacter sp. APW11]|uniref:YcaO-like family protein n=1 Tax=Roseateles aquae TaxID=3077235 RepID=A0ABU3PCI1_9BURK|nr:YcaO-like family protein [Paucibacter sp. APW11]MDT8999863.1 YcaO-like family protein [Paucibacter sp. APW11]